jgi:hypothetical protein
VGRYETWRGQSGVDLQVSPAVHSSAFCEILTLHSSAFVEPLADSVAERLLCVPTSSRSYEFEIIFTPTPTSARSLEAYDLASPALQSSFTKRKSWLQVTGKKVRFCHQYWGNCLRM